MPRVCIISFLAGILLLPTLCQAFSGGPSTSRARMVYLSTSFHVVRQPSGLCMAQVSQQEAKKGIDKVVMALKRDATAKQELGNIDKVTTILGFGSPSPGTLAVRFNASFKKEGFGRSSIPLPFGLGQSEKSEGRGQMVGQVKASLDMKTGKLESWQAVLSSETLDMGVLLI